jgi:hypothetical protein
MSDVIEFRGLDELIKRMQKYPDELRKKTRTAMTAAILALWENVPPYPSPPEDSTYERTGTLGRTLGGGMEGGNSGQPEVFTIRELGAGNLEGHFGSNLDYAPFVVGDEVQAEQHKGRWWTMKTIADKAMGKIDDIFEMLGASLAKFLEGK